MGVDFDGTICDTSALKLGYILENFGLKVPICFANRTDLRNIYGIKGGEYDHMIEVVCSQSHTMLANPVSGALNALKQISQDHSIHIVTGRYASLLDNAKKWVRRWGIDGIIDGYSTSRLCRIEKKRICESLGIDIMIDDDPGQFATNWGIKKCILLRNGGQAPNGTLYARVASNWGDVLALLNT